MEAAVRVTCGSIYVAAILGVNNPGLSLPKIVCCRTELREQDLLAPNVDPYVLHPRQLRHLQYTPPTQTRSDRTIRTSLSNVLHLRYPAYLCRPRQRHVMARIRLAALLLYASPWDYTGVLRRRCCSRSRCAESQRGSSTRRGFLGEDDGLSVDSGFHGLGNTCLFVSSNPEG